MSKKAINVAIGLRAKIKTRALPGFFFSEDEGLRHFDAGCSG
jgi:hypothetical protein